MARFKKIAKPSEAPDPNQSSQSTGMTRHFRGVIIDFRSKREGGTVLVSSEQGESLENLTHAYLTATSKDDFLVVRFKWLALNEGDRTRIQSYVQYCKRSSGSRFHMTSFLRGKPVWGHLGERPEREVVAMRLNCDWESVFAEHPGKASARQTGKIKKPASQKGKIRRPVSLKGRAKKPASRRGKIASDRPEDRVARRLRAMLRPVSNWRHPFRG